jgi:hypothetical protein
MRTQSRNRVLWGLLFLVLLTGCNSSPPREKVTAAVRQVLRGKQAGLFTGSRYFRMPNEIKTYKITNRYTRRIEGEKWLVYDIKAEVRAVEGAYDANVRIGFVRRGREWYFREVRD